MSIENCPDGYYGDDCSVQNQFFFQLDTLRYTWQAYVIPLIMIVMYLLFVFLAELLFGKCCRVSVLEIYGNRETKTKFTIPTMFHCFTNCFVDLVFVGFYTACYWPSIAKIGLHAVVFAFESFVQIFLRRKHSQNVVGLVSILSLSFETLHPIACVVCTFVQIQGTNLIGAVNNSYLMMQFTISFVELVYAFCLKMILEFENETYSDVITQADADIVDIGTIKENMKIEVVFNKAT